jgi:hypothetical protein
VKYAWIDGQRQAYPLPAMCTTLAVSISGYRAWKSGGRSNGKRLRDPQLLAGLCPVHADNLKGRRPANLRWLVAPSAVLLAVRRRQRSPR